MALGLITTGMEDSVQSTLNDVGAEITVSNSTAIGGNTGLLNTSVINEIENISGVIDTAGILSVTETTRVSSHSKSLSENFNNITSFVGMDPDKLYMQGIKSVKGEVYKTNSTEAIIGAQYAEMSNLTIGDTIVVQNKEFNITGIYETGSVFMDDAVYVPLDTLENLTDTHKYSSILVKTGESANNTQISKKIEEKNENLSTLTSEEMSSMADEVLGILNTVSFAVSALAIIVGAIGIVNTMVMTVYERTKEIGVLKSVGWKPRKILTMILGETLVLTTLSGIIGAIAGILISEVAVRILDVNNFALGYSLNTFALAFGITLIVGIIGGIYPARKASKLPPTEALRYE